ncbi:bifunctional diguanylate cyclase/phosphodiesterase [Vibrio sp. WJH972]
MIIINVIVFNNNRIESNERLNALHQNAIIQQKETVRLEVERVVRHLNAVQKNTREKLKQQAKQRVNEAYATALNIYNNNFDKPKDEVAKLIKDALRPIRFFEGRGYFFIFQMDGENVLHSLRPQIEGSMQWNAQDIRGTYILREHIALIRERGGEAFYQWWYPKTGEPKGKEFEKIGYGKYFAPYDWFIGTGEYLDDVKGDVQREMLDWVESYHYGDDGYIFVFDKDAKIIAHPDPTLISRTGGPSVNASIKTLLNQYKQDSGFIKYDSPYMPGSEDGGGLKTSYVKKIDNWDWLVGTGFYLNKFEEYVNSQRVILESSLKKQTTNIVLLSSLFTALTMFASLFVGRNIANRFSNYQKQINHDYTELEKTKNSLEYLALHDSLTQLPNRVSLQSTISKRIAEDSTNQNHLAIAFIDLNSFKKINDLYGHSAGDKLLSILSRKFEILLDPHDTVGRFGGDEFVFCFGGIRDLKVLENKVEQILCAFEDHFVIEGKIITSSCTIGVSVFPNDGNDTDTLIRKADIALHTSKSEQRGQIRYYDYKVDSEVELNYAIEEHLKKALRRDEISVMYQPQIEVTSEKMVGLEALARWYSPQLGQIPPDKFIHIAEETGLIEEIGLWIFRTSCQDIITISPNGKDALNISINISPKQLIDEDLPHKLQTISQQVGIDIPRITLEITENILLDDIERVTPILHQFRTIGFGLSLDDFGTGYSSLSYLNLLPITEIKIDRCFVDKLLSTRQSKTLVKSIIAIGQSCDMEVVAEGVETIEQFEALKEYGCQMVQGYYFDRPLRLLELSERIANSNDSQRHA